MVCSPYIQVAFCLYAAQSLEKILIYEEDVFVTTFWDGGKNSPPPSAAGQPAGRPADRRVGRPGPPRRPPSSAPLVGPSRRPPLVDPLVDPSSSALCVSGMASGGNNFVRKGNKNVCRWVTKTSQIGNKNVREVPGRVYDPYIQVTYCLYAAQTLEKILIYEEDVFVTTILGRGKNSPPPSAAGQPAGRLVDRRAGRPVRPGPPRRTPSWTPVPPPHVDPAHRPPCRGCPPRRPHARR